MWQSPEHLAHEPNLLTATIRNVRTNTAVALSTNTFTNQDQNNYFRETTVPHFLHEHVTPLTFLVQVCGTTHPSG